MLRETATWSSIALAAYCIFYCGPASAYEYRFCVACNNYRTNLSVHWHTLDFGKEWFRVKSAQAIATSHNSQGCSARDYSEPICGSLPEEQLDYYNANKDQINALLSGNPVAMGQAAVEIGIGVPVNAVVATGQGVIHAVNEGQKIIKRVFK